MSRPLRIEYPGAWYHVMNRGRRHCDVFEEEEDFHLFLDILKNTSKMWNLKVSAYCLMSNHYHLLVQTPDGNLSRCMRHLNGVYTQRFNRRHDYDGQLFRGRYKAILVEEDHYLLELLRYIHCNPTRLDLSKVSTLIVGPAIMDMLLIRSAGIGCIVSLCSRCFPMSGVRHFLNIAILFARKNLRKFSISFP